MNVNIDFENENEFHNRLEGGALMDTELDVFNKYLVKKRLKKTVPRETILKVFLKTEKHISLDNFYIIVKKIDPMIGYSTIYRTMKLLCECNLAREIELGDNRKHFEHQFQHEHHDHFVCENCGNSIEFFSEELEIVQEKISKKFSFTPRKHGLIIYGLCKECKGNGNGNHNDKLERHN